MAKLGRIDSVRLDQLDPKQRDLISQAAVDELGLAKKRLAELEGQLRTKKSFGLRCVNAAGGLFVLTVGLALIASIVSVAHRVVMWGWQ